MKSNDKMFTKLKTKVVEALKELVREEKQQMSLCPVCGEKALIKVSLFYHDSIFCRNCKYTEVIGKQEEI